VDHVVRVEIPGSGPSPTSTRSATGGSRRAGSSGRSDRQRGHRGHQDCIDLAPLHNPANLKGIYAARELFGPNIPQIAIFDTSFHSTMPDTSYLYAIPYQLYRRFKIRKYGFHGTSHRYVAYRYRKITGKTREDTNIITLHLGNGCSACAIKGGKSIDTSMGMTPLEGLMMGTRCGDIDATVIEYLMHKEGSGLDEVFSVLNKRSGLLGISGLTNDMRDLLIEMEEHQDRAPSGHRHVLQPRQECLAPT
jgi:acetate kinase